MVYTDFQFQVLFFLYVIMPSIIDFVSFYVSLTCFSQIMVNSEVINAPLIDPGCVVSKVNPSECKS